jgi:hypothetical protein
LVEYQVPAKKIKLADLFKTLTVSTSEEQDDQHLLYSLSLTPKERLAFLLEMNKWTYGNLSIEEMWKRSKKKLIFRKEE